MNIKRAKQEIKDTIEAYFLKNEWGEYEIPGDPAKTDPALRFSGNRKDTDHGADRQGMSDRAGGLYDHTPYQTECHRTSVYFKTYL